MICLKHSDIQKSRYSESLLIDVKDLEEAVPHHWKSRRRDDFGDQLSRCLPCKHLWRVVDQTPTGPGLAWGSIDPFLDTIRHAALLHSPLKLVWSVFPWCLPCLIQNSGETHQVFYTLCWLTLVLFQGIGPSSPVTERANATFKCHVFGGLAVGNGSFLAWKHK